MRAVVYDAPGRPLRICEVPQPEPPPDGAVIRVGATGVCRSDWHAWQGHEPVPLPHTPGHEFAGVVAQIGREVRRTKVGARVTAPFVCGCGRCDLCRRGEAQVCPDQTQPGFSHAGSFADYVVVHAADTNLVAIPAEVSIIAAAALGCRFATAYRALATHARVRPGQTVVIFGCGGVGLSAVMIARSFDARVLAVDVSPGALKAAADLGAAGTIHADTPDLATAIRDLTGGGADVTVDALGAAEIVSTAVRSLRPRGRHVQVGLIFGADAQTLVPMDLVISRELELFGTHGMPSTDYPAMLNLIGSGRVRPERLVGQRIELDEAPAALMAMSMPPTSAGITIIDLHG